MDFSYDHHCFVCGEKNPIGLMVKYTDMGNSVIEGAFTPTKNHEGFPGYLHGGLASTLMDETMARSLNTLGFHGMTARLEVRYREKISLEEPVTVRAKVVKHRKSIVDLESQIVLADKTVAAEATARFMIVGKMDDPNISHK